MLGRNGKIIGRVDIDRQSDESAISEAHQLLGQEKSIGGVEVWQRSRMVHREVR